MHKLNYNNSKVIALTVFAKSVISEGVDSLNRSIGRCAEAAGSLSRKLDEEVWPEPYPYFEEGVMEAVADAFNTGSALNVYRDNVKDISDYVYGLGSALLSFLKTAYKELGDKPSAYNKAYSFFDLIADKYEALTGIKINKRSVLHI